MQVAVRILNRGHVTWLPALDTLSAHTIADKFAVASPSAHVQIWSGLIIVFDSKDAARKPS